MSLICDDVLMIERSETCEQMGTDGKTDSFRLSAHQEFRRKNKEKSQNGISILGFLAGRIMLRITPEGLENASIPSCGAQNLCAVAANFDRCAIPASLHLPQAALRRQCPARGFGVSVENEFWNLMGRNSA